MNPAPLNPAFLIIGIVVVGCGVFLLIEWIRQTAIQPEPWGLDVDEAIHREDAVPVCHHCFAPQPAGTHFCPECGKASDPCTNLLPFDYLFSVGELVRTGATGNFRVTPFSVIGYVLLSMVEYAIFAPIYWFFLLRNVSRIQHLGPAPGPPPAPTSDAE
jgi:hypothetical protein